MAKKTDTEDSPEEAARKKATRLETAIENAIGDFEKATSEISAQVENKQETLRKELNEANAFLTAIKQDLDNRKTQLSKQVYDSVDWSRRKVEDLETLRYVVAVVGVILYLGFLFALKIPLGLESVTPIVTALVLALLVGYSARVAKTDLFKDNITFNQYIAGVWSSISSVVSIRLRAHESFEGIDQGLRSAGSLVKRIATATREYNPALKAVYSQVNVQFRLRNFSRTLANALRFHGLEMDSGTQEWLSSFRSLSDSEPEWLAEASKELAENQSNHCITLLLGLH
jgi:exonuclease VII large subunit